MAISYIQSTSGANSASAVSISAPAQNHTSGNFIVVWIRIEVAATLLDSVTDTAGNTYSLLTAVTNSLKGQMAYATNIIGNAANIVTANFSASVTGRAISVLEYSGITTSSPFDVSSSGSGYGTGHSTGNVTTTQADELAIAGCAQANSNKTYTVGNILGSIATQRTVPTWCLVEDRILSSTGTGNAAASLSGSENWVMFLATFKAAAGGGGLSIPVAMNQYRQRWA